MENCTLRVKKIREKNPSSSISYFTLALESYSCGTHKLVVHLFCRTGLLCCFSGVFAWTEFHCPLLGTWAQCRLVFCVAFVPWIVKIKISMPQSLATKLKDLSSPLFSKSLGTVFTFVPAKLCIVLWCVPLQSSWGDLPRIWHYCPLLSPGLRVVVRSCTYPLPCFQGMAEYGLIVLSKATA